MNRYEVRWSNGYWKAFDNFAYSGVALFYTKGEADEAVLKMNTAAAKRAA